MKRLFFDTALVAGRWLDDVRVDLARDGSIATMEGGASPRGATHVPGVAVPGLPNAHSHAFQRGLAGLTETGSPGGDTFWSWRERMYGFLDVLDPDDVEAIARQAFVEMLTHGFTSVAEFHYLRNAPGGARYDDPVEMARRLVVAARSTGIGLTLLPTLYRAADFGGEAVSGPQRRFLAEVSELVGDVVVLADEADPHTTRVGLALHSLRAVPPAELAVAVEAVRGVDPRAPVHLHVAEQEREVEACLAWSGARPVDWLLDHAPVDEHWCLVHATHVTTEEWRRVVSTGAVVGLCPTTEANLGDGVFPFAPFHEAEGRWAIGSDSNVTVSPAAELRTLEYGQRLTLRRRNVAAGQRSRSTGRALYLAACEGGRRACGRPIGALTVGARADIVVLDPEHPALVGRAGDQILDAWIFAGESTPVRHVFVGGELVVEDGRHREAAPILERYADVARRLGTSSDQLDLDLDGS